MRFGPRFARPIFWTAEFATVQGSTLGFAISYGATHEQAMQTLQQCGATPKRDHVALLISYNTEIAPPVDNAAFRLITDEDEFNAILRAWDAAIEGSENAGRS